MSLALILLALTQAPVDPNGVPEKPLVLELKVETGRRVLRQEIIVFEENDFRVVTRDRDFRWVIEGRIGKIAKASAPLDLKVATFWSDGSIIMSTKYELAVDEFKGGGGGTAHLIVLDVWLRRGIDPVAALVKQLAAGADASVSAAHYLRDLGAEAKTAIPALEVAAQREEARVVQAAKEALDRITKSLTKASN